MFGVGVDDERIVIADRHHALVKGPVMEGAEAEAVARVVVLGDGERDDVGCFEAGSSGGGADVGAAGGAGVGVGFDDNMAESELARFAGELCIEAVRTVPNLLEIAASTGGEFVAELKGVEVDLASGGEQHCGLRIKIGLQNGGAEFVACGGRKEICEVRIVELGPLDQLAEGSQCGYFVFVLEDFSTAVFRNEFPVAVAFHVPEGLQGIGGGGTIELRPVEVEGFKQFVVVGDEIVPDLPGFDEVEDGEHHQGFVRRLPKGTSIPATVAIATHLVWETDFHIQVSSGFFMGFNIVTNDQASCGQLREVVVAAHLAF